MKRTSLRAVKTATNRVDTQKRSGMMLDGKIPLFFVHSGPQSPFFSGFAHGYVDIGEVSGTPCLRQ